MELRRNFAIVAWVLPLYIAIGFAYLFPFILQYAIPIGLTVTIAGLFWQIVINQYKANFYNLILAHIDRKPRGNPSGKDFWKWDSVVQWWVHGDPDEYTDEFGWTTAYLRVFHRGYVHPKYNAREKLHYVVLHYGPKGRTPDGTPIPQKWDDFVKYDKGEGFFDGSVVDVNNTCFLWLTELVTESLADPWSLTPKEQLTEIPAWIRDPEDSVYRWTPHFVVKRGDGSIDAELEREEAALRAKKRQAAPTPVVK